MWQKRRVTFLSTPHIRQRFRVKCLSWGSLKTFCTDTVFQMCIAGLWIHLSQWCACFNLHHNIYLTVNPGSLTPGKGNRLVLSGTEELHDKIDQMASRNRELENALRDLQKKVSDDSHPLLSTELLGINLLQGSSTRASSSSTARTPPGAISPSTHQPPNPMLQDIYEEDGSAQFLGLFWSSFLLTSFQ